MPNGRAPKSPRRVFHLPLNKRGDFLCLAEPAEHKNVVDKLDDNIWAFLHNLPEEICVGCLIAIATKQYDKTWEEDDGK